MSPHKCPILGKPINPLMEFGLMIAKLRPQIKYLILLMSSAEDSLIKYSFDSDENGVISCKARK